MNVLLSYVAGDSNVVTGREANSPTIHSFLSKYDSFRGEQVSCGFYVSAYRSFLSFLLQCLFELKQSNMAHPNDIPVSPTGLATSSINTPAGEDEIIDAINIDPDTVDYWTALLRKNLSTIQALGNINGDGEDGPQVDEEVMSAPRRNSPRDSLAIEIAARLYPAPPESLAPIIKYEKDIVMLRSR